MGVTGATIKVRGRYKPPGDTGYDRALHLYVTAPTKESLDAAVNRINDIIQIKERQTQVSLLNMDINNAV